VLSLEKLTRKDGKQGYVATIAERLSVTIDFLISQVAAPSVRILIGVMYSFAIATH
jgi:hypothetical protein